jgi:hypothetical protein
MRSLVALLLTALTLAAESVVLMAFGYAAILGMGAMALLGLGLGVLFLLLGSPLARVCFAAPFAPLAVYTAYWMWQEPGRFADPFNLLVAGPSLVPLYFVFTGYRRALPEGLGERGVAIVEAMKAEEAVGKPKGEPSREE